MKNIHSRIRLLFLAASIILLTNISPLYSQQITRVAPSNITLRGISIADYNHAMVVGDSATVVINLDSLAAIITSDNINSNNIFKVLPVPVSRSHTFYGVSYYDSLHAIVVGDAGIILTTSDQGKNWIEQANGLTSLTLRAITRITGSTFQIVGDSGMIFRSTDFGVSWSLITSGTTKALYAEAYGSTKVGLAVGQTGTILKTTDGGLSWSIVPRQGISQNYYSVAMLNEDTATAVGGRALVRYTNDGNIWQTRNNYYPYSPVSYAPLRAVAYTGLASIDTVTPYPRYAQISLGDGDELFGLYNRVLIYTTNGWNLYYGICEASTAVKIGDADGGTDPAQMRYTCLAVCNTGPHLVIGFAGANGQIAVSNDSMSTWDYAHCPIDPNTFDYFFASFDNSGYGYSTVTGSTVVRTADNGLTWNIVLNGEDVSGVYCQDSNTAFVAGWNGALFRTRNGGVTWDSIRQITQYKLHDFAFTSPDTGFCVGDGGTIFRTVDGGTTWQDKSVPYPVFLKTIAFSTPQIGVAVGDQGTLLRTTNGGDNWVNNTDQPLAGSQASLKYVQAFPDGTYYVGADSAVMKSTDHGATWSVIFTPPDSVGISFYNSKIGIVGQYSRTSEIVPDSITLRYTSDGGKTWPNQFTVPFYNYHRLLAHWLDDHTFLLYGLVGFIMKVDMGGPDAVTEIISPASPPMKVYPNPSVQKNVTIKYQAEKDGQVTISLYDELGKEVATLYSGFDVQGTYERVLTLDPNLHGTFFIRADESGKVQTLRMIKL